MAEGHSEPYGMIYICPCGCGEDCGLIFRNHPYSRNIRCSKYEFSGTLAEPTVSPSLSQATPCSWHGWLRNGVFTFVCWNRYLRH